MKDMNERLNENKDKTDNYKDLTVKIEELENKYPDKISNLLKNTSYFEYYKYLKEFDIE